MRNKDEFYHSMVGTKTKGGVHVQSRGNEPLPVDLVKVLKGQDAGYIRTQLSMEQSVSLSLSNHITPSCSMSTPGGSEFQRVRKLKEQLASLVDDILPQPVKPTNEGDPVEGEVNGDLDDEWDMYSDEEGPVASGSGRTHTVFTDDLDAGQFSPPPLLSLSLSLSPHSLAINSFLPFATPR
jgi:U3 small nucleolar RNA-associated protein 11